VIYGRIALREGHARLVANAEAYYRALYYGSAASWHASNMETRPA
jgi:hypothetical protein